MGRSLRSTNKLRQVLCEELVSAEETSLGEFKGESTGLKKGESFSPTHDILEEDSVPVSKELGDSSCAASGHCKSWWFTSGDGEGIGLLIPELVPL